MFFYKILRFKLYLEDIKFFNFSNSKILFLGIEIQLLDLSYVQNNCFFYVRKIKLYCPIKKITYKLKLLGFVKKVLFKNTKIIKVIKYENKKFITNTNLKIRSKLVPCAQVK